jgi:hypothetical protein
MTLNMRIIIALLLTLLLCACNDSANNNKVADSEPSRFVRPEFATAFRTVAPAEYLGAAWQENGAAEGVRRIWADVSGDRSLILLRGEGYPALWLNREHSLLAEPVKFDYEPLYVNPATATAYAADGGKLLSRKLPEGEWETIFGSDGSGTIFAVSGHQQGDSIWVVFEDAKNAAEQTAEHSATPSEVDMTPGTDTPVVREVHGDPDKVVRNLTAVRLTGTAMKQVTLPSGDADAAVQIAALKDGRAYAAVGGDVFLLDPDQGATVGQQVYSTDRDVLLSADIVQPAAWVFAEPRGASTGTGRSDEAAVAGEVVAFDSTGKELGRQDVGQIHFSQLAGDWTNQRALLARTGAGVITVDLASHSTTWALRDGGEVPLQLVGDGAQLWTLLPDGISGVGAGQLLRLAPTLAAAQVLPREQIEPLRTAVEALGWDWKSTLISPLSPHSGRITLFNAADPASELAELDWSTSRNHVSRLLAARPALDMDTQFAALTPDEQKVKMQELLTALGWPEAQIDELRSVAGNGEVTYTYTLKKECAEGCAPGEFGLWQGDSVLLTLDAPTEELPEGALALDAAKEKALDAILARSQAAPAVQTVQAGWVVEGRDDLLPEAEGEATPAYEVRAESNGDKCRQYRVLLNANSGELLAMNESSCGPLR